MAIYFDRIIQEGNSLNKTNMTISLIFVFVMFSGCVRTEYSEVASVTISEQTEIIDEQNSITVSELAEITSSNETSMIASNNSDNYVPYDTSKIEIKKYFVMGLNEEQNELFNKACFIENECFCGSYSWHFNTVYNDFITGSTGISYKSFNEFLDTIYTKSYKQKLFEEKYPDRFENIHEELVMNAVGHAGLLNFMGIEFKADYINENEIYIIGTATYYYDGIASDDEEAIMEYVEYKSVMINTNNGWRIDSFESWY